MRYSTLIAFLSLTVPAAFGAGASLHLLQKPAMNKTTIVFTYAGDLWSVPREGGVAHAADRRAAGKETEAAFSPDGETLAFTGEYDGNIDVFTMPVAAACPSASLIIPTPTAWWAGRRTARAFCSAPIARAYSRYTQLLRSRPTAACPTCCRCRWRAPALIRRTASTWLCAARWRTVRHRIQQFRLLETLSRRRGQLSLAGQSRRPEHVENSAHGFERYSIPCGSATRFISSPTATAR